MSENIERALVDMECPHLLQAQQILHLDCINILPVVRWLVSKVIEVRQQTGDLVRVFSEKQFGNYNYVLPADAQSQATKPRGLEYLSHCNNQYAPKRSQRVKARKDYRYRRTNKASENEVVHSALIEYGQAHLYTMALLQKRDEKPNPKKNFGSKIKLPVSEEEEAVREAENAKVQELKLLKAMGRITDDDPIVAKNALSEMMRAKSAEVKDARDVVAEELKQAQQLHSQANEKEAGEFNHQRYIQDTQSKIAKTEKKISKK